MLKKLSSKLETLFDQTGPGLVVPEAPAYQKPQPGFEPESQLAALENLSYIFSGEVTHATLPLLFGHLAPHFEAGFLLTRSPQRKNFRVTDCFAFATKVRCENFSSLLLPGSGVFRILKIPAPAFLKKFGLEAIDPQQRMICYLLALSPDDRLVVATSLAEPWARLKMEALQKTLMKINFSL